MLLSTIELKQLRGLKPKQFYGATWVNLEWLPILEVIVYWIQLNLIWGERMKDPQCFDCLYTSTENSCVYRNYWTLRDFVLDYVFRAAAPQIIKFELIKTVWKPRSYRALKITKV